MTVSAHIDALLVKHAHIEADIEAMRMRPMPDFASITELKKRKLKLKEEIEMLSHSLPKRSHG